MYQLRNEAVAGMFYPRSPDKLLSTVENYLSNSEAQSKYPVKIIIVPHAGYMYSGQTAAASFIEATKTDYKRVILLGPSHHYYFQGIYSSDSKFWKIPTGKMAVEEVPIPTIKSSFQYHEPEHSLEVQIPFIQHILPNSVIVPLLLSGDKRDAQDLAETLESLDSKDTLWVISSDFTHYGPRFGYTPQFTDLNTAADIDQKALKFIQKKSFSGFQQFLQETNATICGAIPILVAMKLAEKWDLPPFQLKKYASSGDISGDYADSVGYASLYC